MRAMLKIGPVKQNDVYVPQRGEVVQYDRLGDGSWLTLHVGDGKNTVPNLPTVVDYDLHDRVLKLETEIAKLKQIKNEL